MRAPSTDLPVMLDGVSVTLGRVRALDRVSLAIHPGAPTAVVGPNGAGKSTLLRVLAGLLPANEGRVTWAGAQAPARRIGFVFQRPAMLRRSAAANLDFALSVAGAGRATRQERIMDLLRLVGLSDHAERPARRLSGGEQQRLAIARALAMDPRILVLDEPAASLDPAGARAVEALVERICETGVKVIFTTHDLNQARRLAGEVALLVAGRLAETGPASELFDAPRTRAARAFLAGDLVTLADLSGEACPDPESSQDAGGIRS
jgi:tungstate transport system ATP-binding protein